MAKKQEQDSAPSAPPETTAPPPAASESTPPTETKPPTEAKPTKAPQKSRAERIEEEARKRVASSLGALTLEDARAAAAAQLDADEAGKK